MAPQAGRARASARQLRRARAGPHCGSSDTLAVTPLPCNLPTSPRSLAQALRRGSPPSWACRRLPVGRAGAASAVPFRDAFLPLPLPPQGAIPLRRGETLPSLPLQTPAGPRPPAAPARPPPPAPGPRPLPFPRPSGHAAAGRGLLPATLPSQGRPHSGSCGGRRWQTCGHQQPTWYRPGSPATLSPHDLPAAPPAPDGSGRRGRKLGGELSAPGHDGSCSAAPSRGPEPRSAIGRALGLRGASVPLRAAPARHFVGCPAFPRRGALASGAEREMATYALVGPRNVLA